MTEMDDYSGEFRPDLRLQDFSKDRLVEFWHTACRMFVLIDGLWCALVTEKLGSQKAIEWDTEVWKRLLPREFNWVRQAGKIGGNDIASVLKLYQIDPGVAGIMQLDCRLENANHGTVTVRSCRSLEYAERSQDAKLMKGETPFMCELDAELIPQMAHRFNPKIRTGFPKLPPRKSRDEVACIWDFRIEE